MPSTCDFVEWRCKRDCRGNGKFETVINEGHEYEYEEKKDLLSHIWLGRVRGYMIIMRVNTYFILIRCVYCCKHSLTII